MTAAAHRPAVPTSDRRERAATALFLIGLLSVFVAVSRRTIVAYDAQAMTAVTRSLVDHGTLSTTGAFSDYLGLNTPYAIYGLGTSLLLVPVYVLSKLTGHAEAWFALTNAVVVTATAVATMAIARALRWGWHAAWAAATVFGLGTMGLQATTELFSEPAVALCTTLMVLGCVRWSAGDVRAAWLIGGAGAAALQFRSDSALTVLMAVGAVLPFVVGRRALFTRSALIRLLVPVVVSLGGLLAYNRLRFGTPFTTSYGGLGFHHPFVRGVVGLLWSPGKGLFVFNPVALLGVVGLVAGARANRAFVLPVASLVVVRVAFFARWDQWYGGVTWGPRFLLPLVPLLCLAAVGAVRAWPPGAVAGVVVRVAFVLLACAGGVINGIGVRVPYEQWHGIVASADGRATYGLTGGRLEGAPTAEQIFDAQIWTWRAAPIVGDVRLLRSGAAGMSPAWWRDGSAAIGWVLLVAGAGSVAVARQWPGRRGTRASEAAPAA